VEEFKKPGAPAHHVLLGGGTIVIEGLDLSEVAPGILRRCFACRCASVGSDGATGAGRAAQEVDRMSALLDDSLVIVLAGGAASGFYR
jgi:hypothetical protein